MTLILLLAMLTFGVLFIAAAVVHLIQDSFAKRPTEHAFTMMLGFGKIAVVLGVAALLSLIFVGGW